jgi:ribosomal protein S27E
MKSTLVDESGNVRCPNCGAINSFTPQRTKKVKATFGPASLVAAPKLRCNGCGTYLKPGGGAVETAAPRHEELPDDWLPSGLRERMSQRAAQRDESS